jgi:hypothetical protein
LPIAPKTILTFPNKPVSLLTNPVAQNTIQQDHRPCVTDWRAPSYCFLNLLREFDAIQQPWPFRYQGQ